MFLASGPVEARCPALGERCLKTKPVATGFEWPLSMIHLRSLSLKPSARMNQLIIAPRGLPQGGEPFIQRQAGDGRGLLAHRIGQDELASVQQFRQDLGVWHYCPEATVCSLRRFKN